MPATHVKQQRSHAPPHGLMGGDRERRGPPRGDRGDREGGYRRRFDGASGDGRKDKEGGAPTDYQPQLWVHLLFQ